MAAGAEDHPDARARRLTSAPDAPARSTRTPRWRGTMTCAWGRTNLEGRRRDRATEIRRRTVRRARDRRPAAGRASRPRRATGAGHRGGSMDTQPGGARPRRRGVRPDARGDRLGPPGGGGPHVRPRPAVRPQPVKGEAMDTPRSVDEMCAQHRIDYKQLAERAG